MLFFIGLLLFSFQINGSLSEINPLNQNNQNTVVQDIQIENPFAQMRVEDLPIHEVAITSFALDMNDFYKKKNMVIRIFSLSQEELKKLNSSQIYGLRPLYRSWTDKSFGLSYLFGSMKNSPLSNENGQKVDEYLAKLFGCDLDLVKSYHKNKNYYDKKEEKIISNQSSLDTLASKDEDFLDSIVSEKEDLYSNDSTADSQASQEEDVQEKQCSILKMLCCCFD